MLPTATPQVTARSRIIRRLMLTLLVRFPRTLFRLFGPPQSLHETNRMTLVPRKVPPRGCATGPLCSPNSSPDGSPPFPSLSPRAAPLCDGDPTKSRASPEIPQSLVHLTPSFSRFISTISAEV